MRAVPTASAAHGERTRPTLSPPAWFFASLIAMVALHVTLPGARWLVPPWTLLGVLPLSTGVALHSWAMRAFRDTPTTTDPEGRPTQLVWSGPYALSRNPMYLAGMPILGGVAVLLGTATSALTLVLYGLAATRLGGAGKRWSCAIASEPNGRTYRAAVRRWL